MSTQPTAGDRDGSRHRGYHRAQTDRPPGRYTERGDRGNSEGQRSEGRGGYEDDRRGRENDNYYQSPSIQRKQSELPRGREGRSHENRRSDSRYENHSHARDTEGRHRDWKCLECYIWNYPDERRCHRCGAYAEDMYPPERAELSGEGGEHKEDVDEFGRSRANKRAKQSLNKKKSDWPPCFETHGADYDLDARCGMFYHADSEFFYDPKTKLYFGNRTATYYRYDEDKKKDEQAKEGDAAAFPFVEVQKVENASSTPSSAAASTELDALLGGSEFKTSSDKTKPSISINLKTKKLSKKSKSKPATAKSTESTTSSADNSNNPNKRKHDLDISKWSERQEEMKQDREQAKPNSLPGNAKEPSCKIARTAKGEPICTLCQRKFPTVEKLRYHERVSKLHAENLRKKNQKAEEEGATSSASETAAAATDKGETTYVDRAQQRRVMHGQDSASMATPSMPLDAPPPPPSVDGDKPTTAVRPEEALDNNVGNAMLQKLGWKSGQSLGRRQQEGEDAATTTPKTQEHLKRDWERIEALASSSGQQRK